VIKRFTAVVSVMIVSVSFAAAEINFDNPSANNFRKDINSVELSMPVPVRAAADKGLISRLFGHSGRKEWTIMVYVDGKNDLEKFALKDMNEMEMIGSSYEVNVVVEVGRIDGFDVSDGDWKGTRRYLIQKCVF